MWFYYADSLSLFFRPITPFQPNLPSLGSGFEVPKRAENVSIAPTTITPSSNKAAHTLPLPIMEPAQPPQSMADMLRFFVEPVTFSPVLYIVPDVSICT